jgi:hypothetical protein
MHGAGFNKFGLDAVDIPGIDVLYQCAGKAILHAEENAYYLHDVSTSSRPNGEPR